MKKIWCLVAMFFVFALSFSVKGENHKKLKCNTSGDFTILIVSDPQCDDESQWYEARNELEILVKKANPDFVLINGDMNSKNEIPPAMWNVFISPLTKRNIYWSTTNGNHDPFKYKNYKLYKSYEYCLNDTVSTTDINYESTRPMNYVLPIYSNDGKKTVFAIYGMDSGGKTENGYEGLTQKQIDWYKTQSNNLKLKNNGNCVTSILCMHIPLPQMLEMYYSDRYIIYGNANEINFNESGYITKQGITIDKINVHTSSVERDNKMFDVLLQQGDVKAVIFGHNHRNNFIGSYNGILLGFAGKISTGCYSDNVCRGGRVIRFNQSAPQNFTVEWLGCVETAINQSPIYSDGTLKK